MKDIIELLQKERIKTVDALKNGNKQELSYLQQIDKAFRMVETDRRKRGLKMSDAMTYIAFRFATKSRGIYNYYHLMMDYED